MTEQDKTIQDLKREIQTKDDLIAKLEDKIKYWQQQLIYQDRFANKYLVERISKYENCTKCVYFNNGKCQNAVSPYSDVPVKDDPESTTLHKDLCQFDWCEIWEGQNG